MRQWAPLRTSQRSALNTAQVVLSVLAVEPIQGQIRGNK
jgi:hypothetical protein